MKQIIDRIL